MRFPSMVSAGRPAKRRFRFQYARAEAHRLFRAKDFRLPNWRVSAVRPISCGSNVNGWRGLDALTKWNSRLEEVRDARGTTRDADRRRRVDDGPCSRRDWWSTSGTRCAGMLGNYESSGGSVCTAFAVPYKRHMPTTFLVWCEQTVDAIAQGRDLAGFGKVGRRPFRQKIFWFSEGYSWRRDPQPRLELTGQRVDSPASAPLKL
jgi:hypothetical protein